MTALVRVTPAGCSQHFNDMVVWRIRLYDEAAIDPFLDFAVEASIADRDSACRDALAVRGIRGPLAPYADFSPRRKKSTP